jgi:prepilin-type N-terminal cleavage/methylation domain-containing protein
VRQEAEQFNKSLKSDKAGFTPLVPLETIRHGGLTGLEKAAPTSAFAGKCGIRESGFSRGSLTGFTLVELLTVMSVILILMSLLVPALNSMRIHAYYVKQKNQFHGMDVAIEFFNTERDGYPDSSEFDKNGGTPYCGAMKLAEAMVGQDSLGFNPQSKFYQIGTYDGGAPNGGIPSGGTGVVPLGNDLYPGRRVPSVSIDIIKASIKERKELYLPLENSNAYRLGDLYDATIVNNIFGSGAATLPVLCDVYIKVVHRTTGKNVGMPVLYYKADTRKNSHDFSLQTLSLMKNHQATQNIYNFMDNDTLVRCGIPTEVQPVAHPMESGLSGALTYDLQPPDPALFYKETWNENMQNIAGYRPYKADSYILMSAGFDGIYGTKDDVFNFEK